MVKISPSNTTLAHSLISIISDEKVDSVIEDLVEQAYRLGINGVPFFDVDDTYAFSGAQPPEIITQVLQRVEKEKR